MSSKIFSHIKKIIIAIVIIIMSTSNGAYALAYTNSNKKMTFTQSLSARILSVNRSKNKTSNKNKKQETKVVVTEQKKAETLNASKDKLTTVNLTGKDRYDTAVLISKKVYPNGANNVILVGAKNNMDGSLAITLANKLDAPILLTAKDKLNTQIKTEIERLKAKKIYLIGGTDALANAVENEVKNMKITTERIAGSNKYKTATAVAQKISSFDKIVICNSKDSGNNVAAIAAIAAENGIPILYNDTKKSINNDTFNFIKDNSNKIKTIYIIGSTISSAQRNTLSEKGTSIVEIKGNNQYEINANMINKFNVKYDNIALVNNTIDSITISYLAAKNKSLFIYANTNLTTEQKNIIKNNDISTIYYTGGGKIQTTADEVVKTLNTKTIGITTSDGSDGYLSGTRLISNGLYQFPEFHQLEAVGKNWELYKDEKFYNNAKDKDGNVYTLKTGGCNIFAASCVVSGLLGDPSIEPISYLNNLKAIDGYKDAWYSQPKCDIVFSNNALEKCYGLHSVECRSEAKMLELFESKDGKCAAVGYEPGHYIAIVPIMDDADGYKFYIIDSAFGYTGKYKSGEDFVKKMGVESFSVCAVIYP